jgi:mannose-6-phosphate isomerase-like protein (cupin superfamily)
MPDNSVPIDRSTAEHYTWGTVCDGWHFLKGADLSVIQERVPPGAGEIRHFHSRARQCFYVLAGTATLEFTSHAVNFGPGQGVHMPPNLEHRLCNRSTEDVVFLVISSPTTGRKPEPKVTEFIRSQPLEGLFVSIVTFAEIRFGIELLPDATRRSDLNDWLAHKVRPMFEQRVLAISEDVMFKWRLLVEDGRKAGHTFSQPDLIIAATARASQRRAKSA